MRLPPFLQRIVERQPFALARAAYVGVVLLATLTQLDLSANLGAAGERLVRAFSLTLDWRDAIDGLRNAVLFAGLGGVWVVTSFSGRIRREIRNATLFGFALSVFVEGLQVFSPVRTASIVDVTTNTLGAWGGALATTSVIVLMRRSKERRSYLGLPALLLASAYALATLCEAVTPLFREEAMRGLTGGPLERWRAVLAVATPLSWNEVPLVDLLLFAPAGWLVVMALSERGWTERRRVLVVAAVGAALCVAAESVHGLFGVSIRWEAAITHAVAVIVGALLAGRQLAGVSRALRGSNRALAASACYVVLLVMWAWRPFVPRLDSASLAAQLAIGHWIPLASLAVRVDVFSALHVAQQFLLYVPLGGLLAVWPLRTTGRWAHLRPALGLAVLLEAGHVVIDERLFDVTNFLIAWAGLAMAWVVVRRSGYRAHGEALAGRRGKGRHTVRMTPDA